MAKDSQQLCGPHLHGHPADGDEVCLEGHDNVGECDNELRPDDRRRVVVTGIPQVQCHRVVQTVGVLRALLAAVHEGAQGEDGGRPDLRHGVFQKFEQLRVRVVPGPPPTCLLVLVPRPSHRDRQPPTEKWIGRIQVLQADGDEVVLLGLLLPYKAKES